MTSLTAVIGLREPRQADLPRCANICAQETAVSTRYSRTRWNFIRCRLVKCDVGLAAVQVNFLVTGVLPPTDSGTAL